MQGPDRCDHPRSLTSVSVSTAIQALYHTSVHRVRLTAGVLSQICGRVHDFHSIHPLPWCHCAWVFEQCVGILYEPGTLAASSSSGIAIWRIILRWAGPRVAPKLGVAYAHEAPFSFARNRNTCRGYQRMLKVRSPTHDVDPCVAAACLQISRLLSRGRAYLGICDLVQLVCLLSNAALPL